jgi:hypothetical protein
VTKDNAKDFMPLVQALADGKVIQVLTADNSWIDLDSTHDIAFCGNPNKCRIKAEARRIWVVEYSYQEGRRSFSHPMSKGEAETIKSSGKIGIVEFVEVVK